MNFDLNEDELMLKALAERFVEDRYDLDRRRTYLSRTEGFSSENWALLGELGLTAVPFSVAAGGMGGNPTDMIILFEALGRGLILEPLIDACVLAGTIFEGGATDALKASWLPDLMNGTRRTALAHRERGARDNIAWVETHAIAEGGEIRLHGQKLAVSDAVGSDGFIVSARSADQAEGDGIELYFVPAGADGLVMRPYRQIDGSVAAVLDLDGVVTGPDARIAGGIAAIEDGETRADLARCAEALGIMETIFAATIDYVRQRRQFGVAIGSFQAVQHRMVDQYARLDQARSLLYMAAMADPAARDAWRRTIAGARAFIGEASVDLGHEAIQLHGGMGVSDELMIGHAHKRLVRLSRHPMSPEASLDIYAGVAA